jgi:hypothetical protein
MSCGVLGDRARRVRQHVLENPAQSLNDVVIIDLTARHPRRVVLTGVLVAEGVASHQWLHPPLHEAEGHVLDPQPGFSQSLNLLQQLG